MLIDLRTYTQHTPGGELDVETIIERARAAGLDGVCITDRGHSRHAARWVAAGDAADFFVGVGVEIETESGSLIVFPREVDAFLEDEVWRRLQVVAKPLPGEVMELAASIGAAVVATGVYDSKQRNPMGDGIFRLEGLAAVDVLSPGRRTMENELTVETAQALRVPGVAGSGALTSPADIGKVATLFGDGVETQADLVELLEAGDAWAVRLRERPKDPPRERSRSSKGGDRRGSRSSKGGGRRRSSKGGGRRRSSKGGDRGRGRRRSKSDRRR